MPLSATGTKLSNLQLLATDMVEIALSGPKQRRPYIFFQLCRLFGGLDLFFLPSFTIFSWVDNHYHTILFCSPLEALTCFLPYFFPQEKIKHKKLECIFIEEAIDLYTAQLRIRLPCLDLNAGSLVSRRDVRVCVKKDSGRWGEKVDRRNVLGPQGVES